MGADALHLTPRHFELAGLVGDGLTNQEAATRMGLSLHTVRVMNAHMHNQLDLRGWGNPRVRLAAMALKGQLTKRKSGGDV